MLANEWISRPVAALRGARSFAYLIAMSQLLRVVRLALGRNLHSLMEARS